MTRVLAVTGCISGAISVLAGAFGAHSLRASVSPEMLEVFETASRYQMYHALALLFLSWVSASTGQRSGILLQIAAWSFVAGTLLFSGSLYAYTFTRIHWLVFLTPVGGTLFVVGWIASAVSFWNTRLAGQQRA